MASLYKKDNFFRHLGWLIAALPLFFGCKEEENSDNKAWTEPQTLNADATAAAMPKVTVAGSGNVVIVWQDVVTEERADTALDLAHATYTSHGSHAHFDEYSRTEVWARYYDPAGDNWSTPQKLQTGDWVKTGRIVRDTTSNDIVERQNVPAAVETSPVIDADAQGNAIAVWQQLEQYVVDATNNITRPVIHIWAARFDGSTHEWATPFELDQAQASVGGPSISVGDPLNARAPDIAVNANGHAVVTWEQWSDADNDANGYPDNVYNVYTARYTAGSGWGSPTLLSQADLKAGQSRAAIDANGNAIVVFRQFNETAGQFRIYARRYSTSSASWQAITAVSAGTGSTTAANASIPDGEAHTPALAMNGDGEAVVLWPEWDGVNTTATATRHNIHIYANRFVPASGWDTPQRISDPNAAANSEVVTTAQPQVAIDTDGSAIAVWTQYVQGVASDGGNSRYEPDARGIWSSRFDATAAQWGTAEALDADTQLDAESPRIAFTDSGSAMAAWLQRSAPLAGSAYNVYGRSFTTAAGWGAKTQISDGVNSSFDLDLTGDSSGNVWTAWKRATDSEETVQASRFQP